MKTQSLALGLGAFSLGLGLYEVVAPGHLSRVLGLEGKESLLRFYGFREIAAGIGIFAAQPNPAPFIWSRVGGDVLDLGTLGTAFRQDNPKQRNATVAVAAVLGVTLLDAVCSQQLSASASGVS